MTAPVENGAQAPAAASRSERRLAIAGASVFALMLLVAIGLWVRHGEEIFVSRVITAIANCF